MRSAAWTRPTASVDTSIRPDVADRPVQDPERRRPDMPTSAEGQDLLVADYLAWLAERTDEQFDAVLSRRRA